MVPPWLLDRLRVDPAFGSGPIATVAQDLLSIIIYLATAQGSSGDFTGELGRTW